MIELALTAALMTTLDSMRSIEGTWNSKGIAVEYRFISNHSAMVESWRSPSGRETITVYFMDGRNLLATHYCAQGNQATLALTDSKPGRSTFRLLRATGVDEGEGVLVELVLETGSGGLRRIETYRSDGKDETTVYDFAKGFAGVRPAQ